MGQDVSNNIVNRISSISSGLDKDVDGSVAFGINEIKDDIRNNALSTVALFMSHEAIDDSQCAILGFQFINDESLVGCGVGASEMGTQVDGKLGDIYSPSKRCGAKDTLDDVRGKRVRLSQEIILERGYFHAVVAVERKSKSAVSNGGRIRLEASSSEITAVSSDESAEIFPLFSIDNKDALKRDVKLNLKDITRFANFAHPRCCSRRAVMPFINRYHLLLIFAVFTNFTSVVSANTENFETKIVEIINSVDDNCFSSVLSNPDGVFIEKISQRMKNSDTDRNLDLDLDVRVKLSNNLKKCLVVLKNGSDRSTFVGLTAIYSIMKGGTSDVVSSLVSMLDNGYEYVSDEQFKDLRDELVELQDIPFSSFYFDVLLWHSRIEFLLCMQEQGDASEKLACSKESKKIIDDGILVVSDALLSDQLSLNYHPSGDVPKYF